MTPRTLSVTAASLLALALGLSPTVAAAASAGPATNAIEVTSPITGFNEYGTYVNSTSCTTGGNCVAVGDYSNGNVEQPFLIEEVNGKWEEPVSVQSDLYWFTQGAAALDTVSCTAPGYCSAAGTYFNVGGYSPAFVMDEVNGAWGAVTPVTSTATGFAMGSPWPSAISCTSAGNCTLVGLYSDGTDEQPFILDEVGGIWGSAAEVTSDLPDFNGDYARLSSVACTSTGNCSAAGTYTDPNDDTQAFVMDEVDGAWGSPREVTSSATGFNTNDVEVDDISCGSPGNCSAVGAYLLDESDIWEPFTVNEVDGTWGNAIEVTSNLTNFNEGAAALSSISCTAAGDCSAAGYFSNVTLYTLYFGGGIIQAFVMDEVGGVWQSPATLVSSDPDYSSTIASAGTISCSSPGDCVVGGSYGSEDDPAFVAQEVNGAWGDALTLTGSATGFDSSDNIQLAPISCASDGTCAIMGSYDNGTAMQPFVTEPGTPPAPTQLTVTSKGTSISGTWTASTGATSYTCTLLYGYNNPSSFSTTTSSTTCTFAGLSIAQHYGMSVVANANGTSSSPVSGFAPFVAPTTIQCVRKGHPTVSEYGVDPTCPAGYRKK